MFKRYVAVGITLAALLFSANAEGVRCDAKFDEAQKTVCVSVSLDDFAAYGCSFLVGYDADAAFLSAVTDTGAMLTSNGAYAPQTAKITLASAYPLPTDVPLVAVTFDVSDMDADTAVFPLSMIKAADENGGKTSFADTACEVTIRAESEIGQTPADDAPVHRKHVTATDTTQNGSSRETDTPRSGSDAVNEEKPLSLRQIVLTIGQKAAVVFGETVENDVAPIIVHDRTMLPARFVAEALGAKVDWDERDGGIVTIRKDDVVIRIFIGKDIAKVNGKDVTLDAPAFIENDRTYTPVRFIVENLGAAVDWDDAAKRVTITAK